VSQQTVRMITGVAHHLDRLAEQVTEVTSAARSLASAVLRIESSMALLQERTRIQQESFDRTHRELEAVWGPLVQQLVSSQTRRNQDAGVENVERYRLGVELKQLRQTIDCAERCRQCTRSCRSCSRAGCADDSRCSVAAYAFPFSLAVKSAD
jgi:hypothetical protein